MSEPVINLRDWSATEVMKWTKHEIEHPYFQDGRMLEVYVSSPNHLECEVASWRPDEKRDQLFTVVKSVVGQGVDPGDIELQAYDAMHLIGERCHILLMPAGVILHAVHQVVTKGAKS